LVQVYIYDVIDFILIGHPIKTQVFI